MRITTRHAILLLGFGLAACAAEREALSKYPVPTHHVLMPGDHALWPQLTSTQQARALQFLEDGSTIRSSLQGD